MYGLKIAFQDYNQYDPSKSTWVVFQQFIEIGRDAFERVVPPFVPMFEVDRKVAVTAAVAGYKAEAL